MNFCHPPLFLRHAVFLLDHIGTVSLGWLFKYGAQDLDLHGCLESRDEIPKPHAFTACVRLDGAAAPEIHNVAFEEHDHDHSDGDMKLGDKDDAQPVPAKVAEPAPATAEKSVRGRKPKKAAATV